MATGSLLVGAFMVREWMRHGSRRASEAAPLPQTIFVPPILRTATALRRAAATRPGWPLRGLVAGLIATAALAVALAEPLVLARTLGGAEGTRLERWLWALDANALTRALLGRPALALGAGLAIGIILALAYAR